MGLDLDRRTYLDYRSTECKELPQCHLWVVFLDELRRSHWSLIALEKDDDAIHGADRTLDVGNN